MTILPQSNLHIQNNPYLITNIFFHWTRTKNSTIFVEIQETLNRQSSLEKGKAELEAPTFMTSDYPTCLQSLRQYSTDTEAQMKTNGTR